MELRRYIVNIRSGDWYDVYIGRPSIWSNPYTHKPLAETQAQFQVATRWDAIVAYEEWLLKQPELMARLPELKGKILGCHCRPLFCHGMVLAKYANVEVLSK